MLGSLLTIPPNSAAGQPYTVTVAARRFNKLSVCARSVTALQNCVIDVILRPEEGGGDRYLANGVPLYTLAERSDLFGGFSLATALLEQDQDAAATGDAASQLAPVSVPLNIDFNQLMLSGKDQLVVTVTTTGAFGPTDSLILSWAEEALRGAEVPLAYRKIEGQFDFQVLDPQEIWAYRRGDFDAKKLAGAAMTSDRLEFEVRFNGATFKFSGEQAWAYTAAEFRSELGPRRMVLVYQDGDDGRPMETVNVNCYGSDAANWSFLVVERVTNPSRISVKGVEIHREVLSTMERIQAQPDGDQKLQALRHSGRLNIKPAELRSKLLSISRATLKR